MGCFLFWFLYLQSQTTKEFCMKIGLDWSGVIANVQEARRLLLMELYGEMEEGHPMYGPSHGNENLVPFSPEYQKAISDITIGRAPNHTFTKEWVFKDKSHEQDGTLLTITEEQYEAMKVVLYENAAYAGNIPPIHGALSAIRMLIAWGHDVSIVTSRGPGIPQQVVAAWCKKHHIDIPIVFGQKDKTKILHEYDLFVDDKKRQLAPEDTSLETIRILFMHYYNVMDIDAFIYGPRGHTGYCPSWDAILRVVARRMDPAFWLTANG